MLRFHVGPANIYLTAGLALLAIALACAATTYMAWPVEQPARLILTWGIKVGFLGGLVLYAIGRITQILRARAPA